MRLLTALRYLLIWPAVQAVRTRSRRSLTWRLVTSHLLTVLLTLVSLFAVAWCVAIILTLIQNPSAKEPAEDARSVAQLLGGAGGVEELALETNQQTAFAIFGALAGREVKLDREADFEITFSSPRRLEHVRSISLVDSTGTVRASSDPTFVGQPAGSRSAASMEATTRALTGSRDLRANSIIREEGGLAGAGAFPIRMSSGESGAILVEKTELSNPRSAGLILEALKLLVGAVGLNLLIVAVPGTIVALLVAVPRARSIVRPVRELSDASAALARGDLGRRVSTVNDDEIGALEATFNAMAADLQRTVAHEARERRRVEERTRELTALLEISRAVASTLELRPLVGLVLDQLRSVIEYTEAAVLALEADELNLLDARSADGVPPGARFPVSRGDRLGAAILRGEPVRIADVRADEPMAADFRRAIGEALSSTLFASARSWLGVPLALQDRVIGVLTVSNEEPGFFDERHERIARGVADLAALAIENARLYGHAASLAALEERTRLARDLHDSVTQSVFSLGMLSRAARTQHERGLPALGTTLERLSVLAGEALAEMRALVVELRPSSLVEEGLGKALEKLVVAFRVRTDARIVCTTTADPKLSPEAETAMFRVVQEALGNAVKHAWASEVRVDLQECDHRARVTVADDGIGFDPAAPAVATEDGAKGGMGLRSMQERATAAGLMLTIESVPGTGTTVTIEARLPV
jgi:signal transduction histidine kinase